MPLDRFLVAVGIASLVGASVLGADASTQHSHEMAAADQRLLDSSNSGDLVGVRAAIAAGANVDALDAGEMTPLLWAAWRGNVDVATYLIRHDANTEARGSRGMTALMMASANGSLAIVDELLRKGVDVNASTAGQPDSCGAGSPSKLFADARWTALTSAAGSGYGAIVRRLVAAGADMAVRDRSGRGVVAYAATADRSEALEALLDLGARIDVANVGSQTALTEAIVGRKTQNALILLARGADPSIPAYNGMTPLFVAINTREPAILRAMIAQGVDLNRESPLGRTALICALENHDALTARLLLESGAQVNLRLRNGDTPLLFVARKFCALDLIQLLVSFGADVHARDADGLSALDALREQQNCSNAIALLEAGAVGE